ncbi:MarR family transcriptional regulator [Actinokineospora terrae]|uniref:MarR family transcriptional regulator n=1 Tax=Actinokineospora terrae TaxID=155974 RepID=UPI001C42ED40|nr:MarR family transcriptional regulator [Actinokineospora terrae]
MSETMVALALALDRVMVSFAAACGLHPTDLRAVLHVATRDLAYSAGELGAALNLNSASVTALIDRLAGVGLVYRVADTEDRRRVRVELTEVGTDIADAFDRHLHIALRTPEPTTIVSGGPDIAPPISSELNCELDQLVARLRCMVRPVARRRLRART